MESTDRMEQFCSGISDKLDKMIDLQEMLYAEQFTNCSSRENGKAAMCYAYRYLLKRESESKNVVESNTDNWRTLRGHFTESDEYLMRTASQMGDMYVANYVLQKLICNGVDMSCRYEMEIEKTYRKLIDLVMQL